MFCSVAIALFWCLFWGCLCFILCAGRLSHAPKLLGLAALACGLRAYALMLPPWPLWAFWLGFHPVAGWHYQLSDPANWLSKIAGILWSLLIVYGLRWTTSAEAGLHLPRQGSARIVTNVLLVVAAGVFIDAFLWRYNFMPLNNTQRVFYLIMPGLEEELFYRGALLGVLSRVFPKTLPLLGVRTSWGGVVGILLFVLGHGLKVPTELFQMGTGETLWLYICAWLSPSHFPPAEVIYHLFMATVFLWVREHTDSLWPAIGAHCLMNGCIVVGHALT